MIIEISIKNAITGEKVQNNTIEVDSTMEAMNANHQALSEAFPDCFVNFVINGGESVFYGMPHNQKMDEIAVQNGTMSEAEYFYKWYMNTFDSQGLPELDIPDEEIERQVDMLLEDGFLENESSFDF